MTQNHDQHKNTPVFNCREMQCKYASFDMHIILKEINSLSQTRTRTHRLCKFMYAETKLSTLMVSICLIFVSFITVVGRLGKY